MLVPTQGKRSVCLPFVTLRQATRPSGDHEGKLSAASLVAAVPDVPSAFRTHNSLPPPALLATAITCFPSPDHCICSNDSNLKRPPGCPFHNSRRVDFSIS